jgi:hypothetical protein
MNERRTPTDAEILKEARAVEAAVQEGVRRALIVHKALGNPIVVCKDGEVRWIPASEIEIPPSPAGYNFDDI